MAASGALTSESADVSQWLKNLPLAPEYHPTLAEFQDPIAYILKIEKEASNYGICKIVPPVLSAPKKTAIANLNRSLAARSASKSQPTFTTRQQQIGFCPRKPRPVRKSVWQSGDDYTFQEFEAKAKAFEKGYLKKCSKKVSFSPLEIETLYWKATVDKPFSVEYANDMPGSAFSPRKSGGKGMGEGVTVGETEWNMRGVSRAKGSLLRFMKEEIPGVTSPMVYIAMMFSWFAWHVEDHDLHSLNYLHMGAGKTWYGVPREAAVAFEDVVRVHGYGGEINPLVTFSVLGEKTTIMSPEVFVSAGVPCCRLVQNAGEFVVTFPRAYHSGFSHGFNCGEAANIATPEWLKVAKDAAIRRASINYPPMVSHFQLLYDLALELCTRMPVNVGTKPRSSRLKDKQKGEGDTLVKQLFIENVAHNNELLHKLGKGSSVVLLPRSSSDISVCSNLRVGQQFCRNKGIMKSSGSKVPYETVPERNLGISQVKGLFSMEEKFASQCDRSRYSEKLSDQRLFSCATCGILSFDCIAIIQPREAAARYLMSADCSFFNDWIVGSGVSNDGFTVSSSSTNTFEQNPFTNQNEGALNTKSQGDASALDLLASNYANSSDSEDEMVEPVASFNEGESNKAFFSTESKCQAQNFKEEWHNSETVSDTPFSLRLEHEVKSVDFATHSLTSSELNGSEHMHRDAMSIPRKTSKCSSVVHDTELTKFNRVVSFSQRSDEDSSRMHVFCLEHAVEVEQRFCQIGGVHMLLLCHPEYPRIEAEAKLASEELGIDCFWNDITFRDAKKEDEGNIQSAFDSEEAIPGNGDWAVKLGINLFYSANLSRSSLYSKQMPYNYVIYNAFGFTSPSPKHNVYGRRFGKQRKVVAGRWCGKVWMSNQAHPFLTKRDFEDQDCEHEQERSFSEKLERKLKSIRNTKTTTAATNSAKKRKKTTISGPAKKIKCLVAEDAASDESEEGVSCKQHIRVYSRKQSKLIQREVSCDSRCKLGRAVEREYEASDSLLGGNFNQRNGRLLRSKPAKYTTEDENDVFHALIEDNARKQRNRFSRTKSKQAKYVERDGEISDDSLDAVSDESLEQSSLERVCRSKYNEQDDAYSDDSVENSSLQLSPRISGGSIEREDDMLDQFTDGEDEISDDYLEKTNWQRLRTLKGKQAKFDDLLVSNIRCQPRVPRSKRTKFVESEDAISAGDDVCLKHFRIPRIKDKYSRQGDNAQWQLRKKTARTNHTEMENISDDMQEDAVSEDNSCKQPRTNLRSKQQKIIRKTKQETPRLRNGKNRHSIEEGVEGGPSTRLRKRPAKEKPQNERKKTNSRTNSENVKNKYEDVAEYECDVEGCSMSFGSKQELAIHKRNICPVKGCGKTFFSHKYLVQHRRVHSDDRPLKCPWKGCKMTFKWAWARTEHIRVHTGARPYVCAQRGCGQTFRFVSDFSRHKRKTGHAVKKNIE